MEYFLHLILGLVAGIVGTLPLGPVNLLVVDTTVSKNLKAGMVLASAASLMELLKPLLAIYFSWLITRHIESNMYIQLCVVLGFILIGIFFLVKKNASSEVNNRREIPGFLKGVLISFLNLPAFPFWLFVIAYYEGTLGFNYSVPTVALLLTGVFTGRYSTLWTYGRMSQIIKERSSVVAFWLNRIIAVLFFLLAIVQMVRILR